MVEGHAAERASRAGRMSPHETVLATNAPQGFRQGWIVCLLVHRVDPEDRKRSFVALDGRLTVQVSDSALV